MRIFVAIELLDDIRAAVADAQERLRRARGDVSWTRVENLHLTLQFLGNVEETSEIRQALEGVAGRCAPFDLTVAGVGAFPSAKRARVLWVGCQNVPGNLVLDLHASLQPLGFEPEHREFSAHVTLGRVNQPRPDAALTRGLDSIKNHSFGAMRVEAIHLFQSQLHPEGSIYSKLSSHELTGDSHHAAKS